MTRARDRIPRKPTVVSLLLAFLRERDDFTNMATIAAAKIASRNNIRSALRHLKLHRTIDCMEAEGDLWWFPIDPREDDRARIIREIKEGVTRPNRRKARPSSSSQISDNSTPDSKKVSPT